MDFADALAQCNTNFGAPPRRFSLLQRLTYLRMPEPAWLRQGPDKLISAFLHARQAFVRGKVVWAHVIQANRLLFDSGNNYDAPGEVVYSFADSPDNSPRYLGQMAVDLGELKGTTPDDPALAPIADYLTDERIRVFGLPVPDFISPAIECRISTVYFVRKHLPGRRLCKPLLPVVVSLTAPHIAWPLPEKFWPETLQQWWTS